MQGLVAYRKLREFRRLHETTYPYEIITQTEGRYKGQLMSTKQRGKVLMNQKANSVADLAAVLLQQEREPTAEQAEAAKKRIAKAEAQALKRRKGNKKVRLMNPVPLSEMTGVEGVKVRWTNPLDAEYAQTWPAAVVHDGLLHRSRYTAAFPELDTEKPTIADLEAGWIQAENEADRTARNEAAALVSPRSTIAQPVTAS